MVIIHYGHMSKRTFLEGSILCPLTFLICNNDLPDALNSDVKLFVDDTSLFSVVHIIVSTNLLNSDLSKINE